MRHLGRRDFLRSAARVSGGVIASPSLFGLAACIDASAALKRSMHATPPTKYGHT